MLKIIIEGQERVLAEAVRMNNRVLFLSSGAIYGKQPLGQAQLPEDWNGAPSLTDTYSAYHEGKRIAELMGNIAVEHAGIHVATARLFAFIAPFLPFGTHFAAGNFMRDALESSEIVIKSGGGSIRSYQYATDLCSSLWALAVRGNSGVAYNVGSETEISIRALAEMIIRIVNPNAHADVQGTDTIENVTRYVPSVRKIVDELNVKNYVNLEEAIRRTSLWSVQSIEEKNK
jgi:dTDP-glucose 4,6-dehydratase